MRDYITYSGDSLFFAKTLPKLMSMGLDYTREIFNIPGFRKILNEEEFDLVLVEGIFGDPLFGLGAHFQCPIVVMNSFEPQKPLNDLVGNPSPFSYVSSIFAGLKFPMSFLNRVQNFLAHLLIPVTFELFADSDMNDIYRFDKIIYYQTSLLNYMLLQEQFSTIKISNPR